MKRARRKGRPTPAAPPAPRTLQQSWQDPLVRAALALVTVELVIPAACIALKVLGDLEKADAAREPVADRNEHGLLRPRPCTHLGGVPYWACPCDGCQSVAPRFPSPPAPTKET